MARKHLNVISLGAGTQSSALCLLAARGKITPMPDAAIFADTGYESSATYDYLEWLMHDAALPFPIHVVSNGNIREDLLKGGAGGERYVLAPWHTTDPTGRPVMAPRQCTGTYKVVPLNRELRELLGAPSKGPVRHGSVVLWLGISTDEASRMKMSQYDFITHRYPLVDIGMSREDCIRWFRDNKLPVPPKSSCVCCPLKNTAGWADLKFNNPGEFADAVKVDHALRDRSKRMVKNWGQPAFVHRSRKPLDEVKFSGDDGLNQFINECEGHCGV